MFLKLFFPHVKGICPIICVIYKEVINVFKFFRKKEVVLQPPTTRKSYKEYKEERYKRFEVEHRAQQVGKDEQIVPNESELVLHEPISDARISSELGIPPTRFYVKPEGITRVRVIEDGRLFDGSERPQELQDFEEMILKGATRLELIDKLKSLAMRQGIEDDADINAFITAIMELHEIK